MVVGLGPGLLWFGACLIGPWGLGSSGFGWVSYAPVSGVAGGPDVMVRPWVRLLIWLGLTLIWVAVSLFLLRSRRRAVDQTDR